MSDDLAPSTPGVVEVAPAAASAKPYDDDMLEVYAKESTNGPTLETNGNDVRPGGAGAPDGKESIRQEPGDLERDVPGDGKGGDEAVPDEATPAESKGDKVEDNVEKVILEKEINGKKVKFSVEDAIKSHVAQEAFNRDMNKRVRHVTERERRFEADQSRLRDNVGRVIEAAQKGDFIGASRALAKLAKGNSDLDVVDFEKQYFSQLDKIRDVYTKLTPDQQKAYWAERQAAEAKSRADRLEQEKARTTDLSGLQSRVAQVQEAYKIPEVEFWENFNAIKESQVGGDKHFKEANDIQVEDVVKYTLLVRHEQRVLDAGKKLGITDDAILDHISNVTISDQSLTSDDIVEIIKTSGIAANADPKAVETLNRKAEKSNSRLSPQVSSAKKANGKIEGYDEESLDFLYRNQPRTYTRVVR